jgi:hypothetical protein
MAGVGAPWAGRGELTGEGRGRGRGGRGRDWGGARLGGMGPLKREGSSCLLYVRNRKKEGGRRKSEGKEKRKKKKI